MIDPHPADSDASTIQGPSALGPILLAITLLGVVFWEFCGTVSRSAVLATL
jgi:hypothetical protein